MEIIIAFSVFALIATFTPGPTNFLVFSNAAQFGLSASKLIILGAAIGATLVVLLVGIGVGQTISEYPTLQLTMSVGGLVWIIYLAYQMCLPSAAEINPEIEVKPNIGFIGASSLQLINPKTWIMATAVSGVYATQFPDSMRAIYILSGLFFIYALLGLIFWGVLGVQTIKFVHSNRAMLIFNRVMAFLLVTTVMTAMLS